MSRLTKKFFTAATVAVLAVGVAVPGGASAALTDAQMQAILDLLSSFGADSATISNVESALKGEPTSGTPATGGEISGIPAGFTFTQNLSQGDSGVDVMYLQILLNSSSDTRVAASGVGSSGSETQFYGPLTTAGVTKFHEKYASDILTPIGLTSGTGFFGPSSRAKANSLLAAAPAAEEPAAEEPGAVTAPTEETAVVNLSGNVLDVRLASDTPAGTTIADAANANFTKFVLTAGDSDVSITKINITRSGLTANADLENVKVLDKNLVNKGSVGSFNVNNEAPITFTPALTIKAKTSSTFYIRAGIVDGTAANKTASLGIAEAADIVSSASTVQGVPVTGNTFNTVTLAIGTVEITEDGSLADSSPNVGDNDVVVNRFRIVAGSGEPVTVHQITAEESGSASLSDTANIELYDVTNGKSLGEVTSWDGAGRASWTNLNLKIAKGVTHRFEIRLDIVDGPSLTVNADLMDGDDVLVDVTGDTYGFFITIDGNDASDWTNSNNGLAANNQSIQSGSMVVTKSPKTPATGNIAAANDQVLAGFDFVVLGEEMRITSATLDFDLGTMVTTEVTSVRLFDADDNIVAGPLDVDTGGAVAFTDTFNVPVGTSTYFVKANISTATSDGDTVDVGINTPATMTVRGQVSGDTVTPTPSTEVEGNTMTVNAGALAATTLSTPVARNIAVGITDFIFATFSLDAAGSGEDVQVTAVQMELVTATALPNEMQNAEIWADLTSANSSRGDKYETKVTNTIQFDDSTAGTEDEDFTFTQTVTVPKDKFVEFALVADLSTAVSADDTFTVSVDDSSNDVTATGASTGQTVTLTATGAGQTMTVVAAGTLTASLEASPTNPSSKLMVADGTDENQTIAVFRLAADNVEDIELDDITFATTNGDRVVSYKFYKDTTLVTTVSGGSTTARAFFDDGELVAPAGGDVKLTVKVDLADIQPTSTTDTTQQDQEIGVTIEKLVDVVATGLASGSSATISGPALGGTSHYAFEAYPRFSVASNSPSGNLTQIGSTTLVAIFNVEAVGGEDIYFDDTDFITFDIDQTMTDSDGTANTWTLKDVDGNTLDTDTAVAESGATNAVFNFGTNTFTVPAGTTKALYVYADTSEMEDDGDTVRVWLDDNSATNDFEWELDNDGGQYERPDIIFRGDIFANSLVNPS